MEVKADATGMVSVEFTVADVMRLIQGAAISVSPFKPLVGSGHTVSFIVSFQDANFKNTPEKPIDANAPGAQVLLCLDHELLKKRAEGVQFVGEDFKPVVPNENNVIEFPKKP